MYSKNTETGMTRGGTSQVTPTPQMGETTSWDHRVESKEREGKAFVWG